MISNFMDNYLYLLYQTVMVVSWDNLFLLQYIYKSIYTAITTTVLPPSISLKWWLHFPSYLFNIHRWGRKPLFSRNSVETVSFPYRYYPKKISRMKFLSFISNLRGRLGMVVEWVFFGFLPFSGAVSYPMEWWYFRFEVALDLHCFTAN